MTAGDLVVTRWSTRFMGRTFSSQIGRGGIIPAAKKREGDGATPAGEHRIVGMYYRPDRISSAPDWAIPIGPRDLWSDDSADPHYNHLVRAPHDFGHERMRRADPLYDLVMITDWNWPEARPGLGSAIFVHRWRRPGYPTAGCVAFAPADLLWIANRVRPGTRLLIR